MDLSAIAAAATQMSQQRVLASAQLSVLKIAMNLDAAGALQLVAAATQSAPQASATDATVGATIDVFA